MKGFRLEEKLNPSWSGVHSNLSRVLKDQGFANNRQGIIRCLKEFDILWNIHDEKFIPIYMLKKKETE